MDILRTYTSPNFDERPSGACIQYIIVHYTAFDTAQKALEWLCDPATKVSAHYLICRTGACYQMVEDHHRAWHAGVSAWKDETNLNHTSLGIELDNNGHEPFSEPQITSLLTLLPVLCDRHAIPPHNILGHEDIAPGRKVDPGPYFPWHTLHQLGWGLNRS